VRARNAETSRRRRLFVVLAVACGPLLHPWGAPAQGAAIHYVYDDLNRLVAVVDQAGSVATYTYDGVGNLLRIDRLDADDHPGPVAITLVSPGKGEVGTAVQVFGRGFSPTPGNNALAFHGTPAVVTAAAGNRLTASVPPDAASGPVTVTTPVGSATWPGPFIVLGTITVSPGTATVVVGATRQFQALAAGTPTASVRWDVNGVPGGDPTVGTISAAGLYTAPAQVPLPPTVAVTATSTDDATLRDSATVVVAEPQAVFAAAAPVSIGIRQPATVDENLTAALSAGLATVPGRLVVAPPLGVRREAGGGSAEPAHVSLAVEPVILAVSPSSVLRGDSVLATLTGAGLAGATDLTVRLATGVDTAVTVTDLTADPDGSRATARVSVNADAAAGLRVLQIATPSGASTPVATGGNTFTVQ
jgi:YD repeat-containing protein